MISFASLEVFECNKAKYDSQNSLGFSDLVAFLLKKPLIAFRLKDVHLFLCALYK